VSEAKEQAICCFTGAPADFEINTDRLRRLRDFTSGVERTLNVEIACNIKARPSGDDEIIPSFASPHLHYVSNPLRYVRISPL
jgi:hypothetical protein